MEVGRDSLPQRSSNTSPEGMMLTIRVAWLIAGTCALSRFAILVIDSLMWHITAVNFRPISRPMIAYLNLATLLSLSFAVVSTCVWMIERHGRRP